MRKLNDKFIERIANAIILLGGDTEIISLVKGWDTNQPNEKTLQQIGNWNCNKVDQVKRNIVRSYSRLKSISTIKVNISKERFNDIAKLLI